MPQQTTVTHPVSVLAGLLPRLDVTRLAAVARLSSAEIDVLHRGRTALEGMDCYRPTAQDLTVLGAAAEALRGTKLLPSIFVPFRPGEVPPWVEPLNGRVEGDPPVSDLLDRILAERDRVQFFVSPPDGPMRRNDLIFRALSLTAISQALRALGAEKEARETDLIAEEVVGAVEEDGVRAKIEALRVRCREGFWDEALYVRIAGSINGARISEIESLAKKGQWGDALFSLVKIQRFEHHNRALALERLARLAGSHRGADPGDPAGTKGGHDLTVLAPPTRECSDRSGGTSDLHERLLRDFFEGGYKSIGVMSQHLREAFAEALRTGRCSLDSHSLVIQYRPGFGFRLKDTYSRHIRVFSQGGRKSFDDMPLREGDLVQTDRCQPFTFVDPGPVLYEARHRYPESLPPEVRDLFLSLLERPMQTVTLTGAGQPVMEVCFYPCLGHRLRLRPGGFPASLFPFEGLEGAPVLLQPGEEMDLFPRRGDAMQIGQSLPFVFSLLLPEDLRSQLVTFQGGHRVVNRHAPGPFLREAILPALRQPGQEILYSEGEATVGVLFSAHTDTIRVGGDFLAISTFSHPLEGTIFGAMRGRDAFGRHHLFSFSLREDREVIFQMGAGIPFYLSVAEIRKALETD